MITSSPDILNQHQSNLHSVLFFYYSTLFDSRFKTLQQNHSELVNPIIQKKEKQYLVKIAVRYLDNETKIENISQYQLTLEKKDNWKIIMNE